MTKYKVYLTIEDVLNENGLNQKEVYTHGNIRAATFGMYFNNRVARVDLKVMAEILRAINELTNKTYTISDLIKSDKVDE